MDPWIRAAKLTPGVSLAGILFFAMAAGCSAGDREAPGSLTGQSRMVDSSPLGPQRQEEPLDVTTLKARLRDTNAIGVFTKLALKNQVDDLLKQFRAHYQGGRKTSVASLRPPYDMLG